MSFYIEKGLINKAFLVNMLNGRIQFLLCKFKYFFNRHLCCVDVEVLSTWKVLEIWIDSWHNLCISSTGFSFLLIHIGRIFELVSVWIITDPGICSSGFTYHMQHNVAFWQICNLVQLSYPRVRNCPRILSGL